MTVAWANSVGVVPASSTGQKIRGAQKAITARAAPMALSAFRTGITWAPLLLVHTFSVSLYLPAATLNHEGEKQGLQ